MPRTFYKNLVSVDWLSIMVRAFKLQFEDNPSEEFLWKERPYGSKQFHHIFDISSIDRDGVIQPFCTFCSEPTLSSWPADLCSMKLANNIFYCKADDPWQDLLSKFMRHYMLQEVSISRCDLACDFLYLRDRVSGPMLVSKLKSFAWWKCGSVKCCEYYKMPYTLKSTDPFNGDTSDIQVFLNNGKMVAGTESMTFGTMSSDAQVCIYDKTLELKRTEVEVNVMGETVNVSAKEYIRDAHKAAGVWDEKRHTWRVEIRLRNKALLITDTNTGHERPLMLQDLQPSNLVTLFVLASDKYFRLVDFSMGGTEEVNAERLESYAKHKERLPIVDLFRPKTLLLTMSKKKYQKNPTRFTKAVISALNTNADELEKAPNQPWSKNLQPSDAKILREAGLILKCVYAGQYADIKNQRKDLFEQNFLDLVQIFNEGYYMPEQAVNLLYKYIFSNRYVSIDFVRKVYLDNPLSNFAQWVHCNFNIIVYYKLMKIPTSLERWVPPVIAPEYQRNIPNIQIYLQNEQHPC